jgi:hypothetical protein
MLQKNTNIGENSRSTQSRKAIQEQRNAAAHWYASFCSASAPPLYGGLILCDCHAQRSVSDSGAPGDERIVERDGHIEAIFLRLHYGDVGQRTDSKLILSANAAKFHAKALGLAEAPGLRRHQNLALDLTRARWEEKYVDSVERLRWDFYGAKTRNEELGAIAFHRQHPQRGVRWVYDVHAGLLRYVLDPEAAQARD